MSHSIGPGLWGPIGTARLAGVLYLVAGLSGAFSFVYVARLVTLSDTTATIDAVLASEGLFRLGMAGELISPVFLILTAVALHRLFRATDNTMALLMVAFTSVAAPIQFFNVLHETAALTLMQGRSYVSPIDEAQRDALAMVHLGLHRQGLQLAQVFWGLWLLPAGVIMMRSGIVRRGIGALLILAGVGYVAGSAAWLFQSPYSGVVGQFKLVAAGIAETAFVAWLLVGRVGVAVQAKASGKRDD